MQHVKNHQQRRGTLSWSSHSAAQWLEDVRNGWRWWVVALGQHLATGVETKRSKDSRDWSSPPLVYICWHMLTYVYILHTLQYFWRDMFLVRRFPNTVTLSPFRSFMHRSRLPRFWSIDVSTARKPHHPQSSSSWILKPSAGFVGDSPWKPPWKPPWKTAVLDHL